MKIAPAIIVLLIAGVLVLGWQLRQEIDANRKLTAQVAERQAADASKRQNFELQAKCGERAQTVFHQLGYKENGATDHTTATYQSHYNPSINKCLMVLTTYTINTGTDAGSTESRFLFDAYENREYAEIFVATYVTNGKVTKIPSGCILKPTASTERTCQSEAEYEAFVAGYME
ncbi:MAG TPA: hypothetical protein VMU06_07520 [Stellaceae bacterium]|nr:hypothetical protein [Stellaceae bacterium]